MSGLAVVTDAAGVLRVSSLEVPAPMTVSQVARAAMMQPCSMEAMTPPHSESDLQALIDAGNRVMSELEARALERFDVRIERGLAIGGVPVVSVTPSEIPDRNRHRLLMNMHGGGFVCGKGCLYEAVPFAALTKTKTLFVDYRMPPRYPFPAGLADGLSVYRGILHEWRPTNIAIVGVSAGGNLTAALALKIREENLPLPAALVMNSPASNLHDFGDTWITNSHLDRGLAGLGVDVPWFASAYVATNDAMDPLISPAYADFQKPFPPSLLVAGTRDRLLSSTVLLHRALTRAGKFSELHVFEGMWHGIDMGLPEYDDMMRTVSRFLDERLGK